MVDDRERVFCLGQVSSWGGPHIGSTMNLTRVRALDGAHGIALGGGMACARVPEGVRCVGRDPTLDSGDANVWTVDIQTETELVHGGETVCAIDAESRLRCWGRESFIPFESPGRAVLNGGVLREWSRDPVLVAERVSTGAVGTHHCLIDASGRVRCVGSNSLGQAGAGSGAELTDIALALPASLVATSVSASCATTASGVWCWGNRELLTDCGVEQCAHEMASPEFLARCQRPQPELLMEIEDTSVTRLQMDETRACALVRNGELRCAPLTPGWWDGLATIDYDVRTFALEAGTLCVVKRDGAAWCEGALAEEVRRRRHESLAARIELSVPEYD